MAKKRGLEEPKRAFRRDAPEPGADRARRAAKTRQAVNVYVDRDILKVAREMKINLSQVLERELEALTRQESARRFYEANKAVFDAHNAHIEKNGTLTEQLLGPDAFDDPAA